MRRLLRGMVILLLGLGLGLGSAYAALRLALDQTAIHVGPWRTPTDAGGTGRDLYTRAMVAVGALLALSRTETIYFMAERDDTGEVLRGDCRYVLTGRDMPARWWSITLYAGDHYLIPNDQNRWSVNDQTVTRDAGGDFNLTLSRTPVEGDWLPTGSADRLFLFLRLYNPEGTVAADPATARLPSIKREACS
ncbi:DUF1214 domain-containing protein [Zavarzinia compransoris]|uniref:DUF1214 domain-containing protein n=1 Tax=Zavarzinia marina TaxID=2911065 RepID=UPI001F16286E|nr:DUF1214 domain-containing protein [Zavarzinia marina]MCF4165356.1 DUF1214 domain-containing protein [Zavarzinia marina]